MERRRLVKRDGLEVDFHSLGGGKVAIETRADVGAQLELNKQRYNDDRHERRKSEFREVAEIPDVIFLKWLQEEGLTWNQVMQDRDLRDSFLRRKLNDPENRYLRTGPERL